jgi:putative flippase GtrA
VTLRLGRFLLSGGLATLVHSGVMSLLIALAIGAHLAFLGGFVTATIARFFVDRHFVFRAKGKMTAQFPRYLAGCVLTYFVSAGLFFLFHDVLYLMIPVAFVLTIAIATVVGYVLLNFALAGAQKQAAHV